MPWRWLEITGCEDCGGGREAGQQQEDAKSGGNGPSEHACYCGSAIRQVGPDRSPFGSYARRVEKPNVHEKYFDHAATSPLLAPVKQAMEPWWDHMFGNPHSAHRYGAQARDALEAARAQIADALQLDDPFQVVFTSGSTESANWAIRRLAPDIEVSPFEHSAVREPALALAIPELVPNGWTLGKPEKNWVAVMAVNNETGACPYLELSSGQRRLTDATQAVGRLQNPIADASLAFFSSHKLGGPPGIGAMIFQEPIELEPFILGGGQEHGMRGGTVAVPLAVGFAEAVRLATEEREMSWKASNALRMSLLEAIGAVPEMMVHEAPEQVPHILSLSFAGIEGESLVVEADARGFAISSGAACSSESTEPSHVLQALGVPEEMIRGTIRVSFGPGNSMEATAGLGRLLRESVARLRNLA